MTKEQFFAIYLGQKFTYPKSELRETLEGLTIKRELFGEPQFDGSYTIEEAQIILRPLSSMTEEEWEEFKEAVPYYSGALSDYIEMQKQGFSLFPKEIAWLIEHGFNIFDGIVPAEWYVYEEGKTEDGYDAEIENWWIGNVYGVRIDSLNRLQERFVWGNVYADKKKRFENGEEIRTSKVVTDILDIKEGCIIKTKNSNYKLGKQLSTERNKQ
jgi:hypothetical protein